MQTQKENLCVLSGHDITEKFFVGDRGIVFRKDIALPGMAEDMAVTPVEIDKNVDAAAFNQTDFRHGIADTENGRASRKAFLFFTD